MSQTVYKEVRSPEQQESTSAFDECVGCVAVLLTVLLPLASLRSFTRPPRSAMLRVHSLRLQTRDSPAKLRPTWWWRVAPGWRCMPSSEQQQQQQHHHHHHHTPRYTITTLLRSPCLLNACSAFSTGRFLHPRPPPPTPIPSPSSDRLADGASVPAAECPSPPPG